MGNLDLTLVNHDLTYDLTRKSDKNGETMKIQGRGMMDNIQFGVSENGDADETAGLICFNARYKI